MLNATCALPVGRTLVSALIQAVDGRRRPSGGACMRPVLDDIASAGLALVVTWSSGGLAAQRGYSDLKRAGEQLFSAHAHTRIGPVRALLIGKGSRCNAHMPMLVHVLGTRARIGGLVRWRCGSL